MPDSVVAYIDSALAIMEGNVIGRDTVDWSAFRARVHERAAGAEIPLDTPQQFPRTERERVSQRATRAER